MIPVVIEITTGTETETSGIEEHQLIEGDIMTQIIEEEGEVEDSGDEEEEDIEIEMIEGEASLGV